MSTKVKAQLGMDERVVEDSELEAKLEAREGLAQARRTAVIRFKGADQQARDALEALDIEVGTPVRIGRFRVTKQPLGSRSVSFETDPTVRLRISADAP